MTTTTADLEAKLATARKQQAAAERDRDAANESEDYLREHAAGLGYGGSNAHRGANKIHTQSRRNAERWQQARERVEHWARKVRHYEHEIAERARVRYGRADLVGAIAVRTSTGWHRVVRVNKTTVSCESGYSWVIRHAFDKVLEIRK